MASTTPSIVHTFTVTDAERALLACDGSYEVVVLDKENRISRVCYRSPFYAAALGYLSKNHAKRAWLDLTRDGQYIPWELDPAPLGTPLVTFVLTEADLADGMVAA